VLEDGLMTVPRSVVECALESAPSRFTIYDRTGAPAMRLGEGSTYLSVGVTNLTYLDPADHDRRDFTLDDIASAARLGDGLPNIDFVTTPGVVRQSADLPIELVNQHEFLSMVTNTTKPLMVLVADAPTLGDIFEMAEAVSGGADAFSERPFVIPYLNPVSPLMFNEETLDKLLMCADRGIPVVCQGAPQVGGSSPVTVASTLVLAAAETLCGLAISQLRRPGTPYITGTVPFVMDMRTGNVASSGPEMLLMMVGMSELAKFWGIPSLGVAGGGDSKAPDEQAAMEPAFYMQGATLGGADLIFDAGSIECGLMFSPEIAVVSDEVMGMYRRYQQGISLDDESLAMDVIREVGPGGFFLGEQHTLEHFRDMWEPSLMSWEARSIWEENGSKTMGQRARERAVQLIAEHEVDALPADVLASMKAIIEARRLTLTTED
jgi:trimethylamine--corrinoid protein Co-methyltransferase